MLRKTPIQVEGILAKHEGPWNRIRGGRDEQFVKLYYSLTVKGKRYFVKKEYTLDSGKKIVDFLKEKKSHILIVDERNPSEVLGTLREPYSTQVTLMLVSILLLMYEYKEFKEKNSSQKPY